MPNHLPRASEASHACQPPWISPAHLLAQGSRSGKGNHAWDRLWVSKGVVLAGPRHVQGPPPHPRGVSATITHRAEWRQAQSGHRKRPAGTCGQQLVTLPLPAWTSLTPSLGLGLGLGWGWRGRNSEKSRSLALLVCDCSGSF